MHLRFFCRESTLAKIKIEAKTCFVRVWHRVSKKKKEGEKKRKTEDTKRKRRKKEEVQQKTMEKGVEKAKKE